MTRRVGHNTDLPSNSNISKTVRVNISFTRKFFREYSITFLMISIDFGLVVLQLLMFKVCGIIGISKIKLFSFSRTERVKLLLREGLVRFHFSNLQNLKMSFTHKILSDKRQSIKIIVENVLPDCCHLFMYSRKR